MTVNAQNKYFEKTASLFSFKIKFHVVSKAKKRIVLSEIARSKEKFTSLSVSSYLCEHLLSTHES